MKIVAISDVHGKWNNIKIPECDLLISAGDYSFRGEPHMIRKFHKWLDKQPAKYIISVQGNRELWVEKNYQQAKLIVNEVCKRAHFIEEDLIEIEGVRIYGSAITPFFHNWAYNRVRGDEIQKHWNKIPENIDILVTHGPPKGIMDTCPNGDIVGCENLLKKIQEIKPKFHIFGHIHRGYGVQEIFGTTFINASICDEQYKPINKPVEFKINE